jgi:hypothetical protein
MSHWFPMPSGPHPPGQAWYPLLGKWGPAHLDPPDEAFGFDEFDEPLAPYLWRTKDGEVIAICDLELSHLRNILRMIERGIVAARERTGRGARTLAERAESDERVRNLLNEWLSRF